MVYVAVARLNVRRLSAFVGESDLREAIKRRLRWLRPVSRPTERNVTGCLCVQPKTEAPATEVRYIDFGSYRKPPVRIETLVLDCRPKRLLRCLGDDDILLEEIASVTVLYVYTLKNVRVSDLIAPWDRIAVFVGQLLCLPLNVLSRLEDRDITARGDVADRGHFPLEREALARTPVTPMDDDRPIDAVAL